jgi:hypothetical protein
MKKNKINLLALLFILVAFVGFMVRLPKVFGHYDKQLHFLFYFYASFIACYFYANNKKIKFLVIISCLLSFGFFIEYLQGYSNRFFKKRIHGSFDIQDIEYNVLGITLYSSIWICNYFLISVKKKK